MPDTTESSSGGEAMEDDFAGNAANATIRPTDVEDNHGDDNNRGPDKEEVKDKESDAIMTATRSSVGDKGQTAAPIASKKAQAKERGRPDDKLKTRKATPEDSIFWDRNSINRQDNGTAGLPVPKVSRPQSRSITSLAHVAPPAEAKISAAAPEAQGSGAKPHGTPASSPALWRRGAMSPAMEMQDSTESSTTCGLKREKRPAEKEINAKKDRVGGQEEDHEETVKPPRRNLVAAKESSTVPKHTRGRGRTTRQGSTSSVGDPMSCRRSPCRTTRSAKANMLVTSSSASTAVASGGDTKECETPFRRERGLLRNISGLGKVAQASAESTMKINNSAKRGRNPLEKADKPTKDRNGDGRDKDGSATTPATRKTINTATRGSGKKRTEKGPSSTEPEFMSPRPRGRPRKIPEPTPVRAGAKILAAATTVLQSSSGDAVGRLKPSRGRGRGGQEETASRSVSRSDTYARGHGDQKGSILWQDSGTETIKRVQPRRDPAAKRDPAKKDGHGMVGNILGTKGMAAKDSTDETTMERDVSQAGQLSTDRHGRKKTLRTAVCTSTRKPVARVKSSIGKKRRAKGDGARGANGGENVEGIRKASATKTTIPRKVGHVAGAKNATARSAKGDGSSQSTMFGLTRENETQVEVLWHVDTQTVGRNMEQVLAEICTWSCKKSFRTS